ncbi:MAG: hypothetical protein JSR39_06480 [Verrucomicrobia bacterium]|nr:hypothetical protein [Verrucomicrobiota bacterium]
MASRSCSLFPSYQLPEIFNPLSDEYDTFGDLHRELTDERHTTTRKAKAFGVALISGIAGVLGVGIFSAPLSRTVAEALTPYIDGDHVGDDYRPVPTAPWKCFIDSRCQLDEALNQTPPDGPKKIKEFFASDASESQLIAMIQNRSFAAIASLIHPNDRNEQTNLEGALVDLYNCSYEVGYKPEYIIAPLLDSYSRRHIEDANQVEGCVMV